MKIVFNIHRLIASPLLAGKGHAVQANAAHREWFDFHPVAPPNNFLLGPPQVTGCLAKKKKCSGVMDDKSRFYFCDICKVIPEGKASLLEHKLDARGQHNKMLKACIAAGSFSRRGG